MRGALTLEHVTRSHPTPDGPSTALSDVSLEVPAGSLVCVLGPSGSGKSTLVRAVNGIDPLDCGRVLIDGIDVTATPPAQRPTATVMQGDTLFPDLTVADNIAYGLRARARRDPHLADDVDVALLRMGLRKVAHRYPHEISGGQRRRTALARAIALRPAVLLLDEPLQGLDEPLRAAMLDEITHVRERLGCTVVLVTHDQPEALSYGDRLVVLMAGRIRHVGPPREVFERPADTGVAEFLGRSNIVPVDVLSCSDGAAVIRVLGREVTVAAATDVRPGRGLLLARPHAVTVRPGRAPAAPRDRDLRGLRTEVHDAAAVVQHVRYRGEGLEYLVECESGSLLGTGDLLGAPLRRDDPAEVAVIPELCWLLPPS